MYTYIYVYVLVYAAIFWVRCWLSWRRALALAPQGTAMIAGGAGIASGSRAATWQWPAWLGAWCLVVIHRKTHGGNHPLLWT